MSYLQSSLKNAKFRHQKKKIKRSESINLPFETRRNPIRNYADHFVEELSSDNHKSLALIQRCKERIAENELFGVSYVLEYLNDQRRRFAVPQLFETAIPISSFSLNT